MGCCVLAVLIIAQAIETWRRVKGLLGLPTRAMAVVPAALLTTLRRLWARPAGRAVLMCVLLAELIGAGAWLADGHREHLMSLVPALGSLVGTDVIDPAAVCSASAAAGR